MKNIVKWLLVMLLPLFATTTVLAKDYQEGTQFNKLVTPQPTGNEDKIEVVELFWYGCPHCYRLDPYLADWLAKKPDDVEFVRLPAILGRNWDLLAKAWYTADLLGVTDKIHVALFKLLHEKKQKIDSEEKLREFFVDHGVSVEDFNKTFSSFAVAIKLNNARLMTRRYAITGVPTIIINGKYATSASLAGGNQDVIKVMDYLIDRERALSAKAAEPGVTAASQ